MFVERFVYRPFYKQPHISSFIVAVGLIFILENGALALWGADFRRISPPSGAIFNVLGITVTSQRLIVIVVAALLIIAIHLFIKKTRWGRPSKPPRRIGRAPSSWASIRAWWDRLPSGWARPWRPWPRSWSPRSCSSLPPWARPVIAMAFVIIILGGMGSFIGAVLGGYIIGLLETLVSTYVTSYYAEALIFGILVMVLAVKPTGLFGKEH